MRRQARMFFAAGLLMSWFEPMAIAQDASCTSNCVFTKYRETSACRALGASLSGSCVKTAQDKAAACLKGCNGFVPNKQPLPSTPQ
jgi:hypothetical protein